jgi:anaerobic magnesium-protoporphyrin IX monomethyl ester cyclase
LKILLTTLNAKYIHINLAIRLLYELNHDYVGLEWKEFTIKENKDEIADFCKDFEVIAFSCYIWNITQTLAVCRKIKALNPSIKILLGGPEVSYDWQDIIVKDEVDFIITGEGETPFKEFLYAYPHVEHLANLVRKDENGTVAFFNNPVIFDLENFSEVMPYRNDPPEELKNKVLYVETSRGCPYKCEFCLASLDNKVRYLPNHSIKANLLYLMQHGKVIKFLDRTFNIKRDFTIDIFTFILEHHRPDNVFQFEITADILHPDIIKFIREKVPNGLFRFEIGIQTVNQKANLEVSRKQSFEKTKSIILQLQDKVEMHLDLIVGMALDYWEDIKYSFEEVFKLFAPELQLGFLKFLKGTPVRYKADQHGFIYDPEPPYQIIESKYLTKEELARIVILENALEIYWNKGRALHTLKYVTANYSIFDFLLGLGEEFGKRQDFHKYTLNNVFDTLADFAEKNYPEDAVLRALIAIDYHIFHKIRPKNLYLEEVEREERTLVMKAAALNHQKYRHIILPIGFDFEVFEATNQIEMNDEYFIIQYNGTQKPEALHYKGVGRTAEILCS